jgi:hypothetical protein
MGFGLEIEFTNHFNTQLVTTFNYSAITDLHTLQITTAHAKYFQSVPSPVIPWLMASNSQDSSASMLTSLPAGSQLH